MTQEFAGGQDLCLRGEEFVEDAVVQFLVEVGAAVLDYDEAIIGIGGFAEGGEDAAPGEGLHCAGSTVSLRPMALVTATSVDRRGVPLTDNGRQRVSRASPAALAALAMT